MAPGERDQPSPVRGLRRATAVGAAAVLLVTLNIALPAGAAFGQRVTGEDPSGDAKAAADIVSVTYNNGSARLGVLARIRNLKGHGSLGLTIQKPRWSGRALLLRIVKSKQGRTRAGMYRERPDGAFYRLGCKVAARWRPRKNRVHVTAPQRCVRSHKGNWLMWTFARAAGDLDFTHTSKVPFD